MNMACTLFRLTPAEALAGFTVNAAAALGLAGEIGRIAAGLRAELALWNVGPAGGTGLHDGVQSPGHRHPSGTGGWLSSGRRAWGARGPEHNAQQK
jgi:imidazolonepropionase-like amidohydrolase